MSNRVLKWEENNDINSHKMVAHKIKMGHR